MDQFVSVPNVTQNGKKGEQSSTTMKDTFSRLAMADSITVVKKGTKM